MENPELQWAKDLLGQATTAKSIQEQSAYIISCLGALIAALEQPVPLDIGELVDWGPSNDPYDVATTVSDGLESSEVPA